MLHVFVLISVHASCGSDTGEEFLSSNYPPRGEKEADKTKDVYPSVMGNRAVFGIFKNV